MSWLEKLLPPKIQQTDPTERRSVPEGLWVKCPACETVLYNTDLAQNVIVVKRGKGTGFAGIENALFYADNTRMLYGDGAEMASALVSELKALDGGH